MGSDYRDARDWRSQDLRKTIRGFKMSEAQASTQAKNDGATFRTKAGFKASGLNADGGYGPAPTPPVPAPPPPSYEEQKSQVGSIQRTKEDQLIEKLMVHGGLTREQAKAKVSQNNKATGYR